MKKLFLFLAALTLILAGAAYFLMGNLDKIVKEQVEKHGSEILSVPVVLSEVEIRLLDGFGELRGFSIANPTGFSNNSLMSFDTVRLDIDTENLSDKPFVVEEILIDSLSALYEVNGQAQGNMNALLKNLPKSGSGNTSSGDGSTGAASEGGSDIRIAIKQIVVKDTKLTLDLEKLGLKVYDETLPTFTAKNIGGKEGLPPEQLGIEISKVMLDNLTKQARKKQEDKLKKKAINKIKEEVEKKAGDKAKSLMEKLGHSF